MKSILINKTKKSIIISGIALILTYVLEYYGIADGEAYLVALLGPIVNIGKELLENLKDDEEVKTDEVE